MVQQYEIFTAGNTHLDCNHNRFGSEPGGNMDKNYSWNDQDLEEMQSWHEFQGSMLEPGTVDSVAFRIPESQIYQLEDDDELDDETRISLLYTKIRMKSRFGTLQERKLLETFERYLDGDPEACVELGDQLARQGQLDLAKVLFQEAHDSGSSVGTRNLGLIDLTEGKIDTAEQKLKEALANGAPHTHYFLFITLSRLGRRNESEDHLVAAYLEKDVNAIRALGLRSAENEDFQAAEQYFREGMNLGNSDSARELIKVLKRSRKRKIEVNLYRQALEEANTPALSALKFLLFSKHSREILDLKSTGAD
jgi:tetratricopeptide (TPR) repeat protein